MSGGSDLCGDVEFPLQLHLPLTKVVIHITCSTDKHKGCTRTRESQSYLATHEGQEEQVLRVATSMSLCRCVRTLVIVVSLLDKHLKHVLYHHTTAPACVSAPITITFLHD
jgi:hypothetical protein